MYVDVNNARLWVEDEGTGPAIVFMHGGLGDVRLFEPQARALSDGFRCIRYDRRWIGRTEAPAEPYSTVGDAVGLLDALEIERAAFVGLSDGGGHALDVAFSHPERVTKLVHIAGGASGMPVDPYTPAQEQRVEEGGPEDEMAVDFEVWAPLGADDHMRELWRATSAPIPEGAVAAKPPDIVPEQVAVPVLVIVAKLDPPAQIEVGRELARRMPNARLVEVDSDHYLTLREPDLVTRLIREFLNE